MKKMSRKIMSYLLTLSLLMALAPSKTITAQQLPESKIANAQEQSVQSTQTSGGQAAEGQDTQESTETQANQNDIEVVTPIIYKDDVDVDLGIHPVQQGISNYSVGEDEIVANRALPAKYDVRSTRVSNIRSQAPYGTCWAFATIACSEMDMISKEMEARATVDNSEAHMAYYMYHSSVDEYGGTAGDSVTYTGSGATYLDGGGNSLLAAFLLPQWEGVVAESTMPYYNVENNMNNGVADSYAYSKDIAHLQNTSILTMDEEDREYVKQLIMEHGAVASSYCDAGDYGYNWNRGADGFSYYCNILFQTNHAITIVGWDDNYAVTNFAASCQPTQPGAWLIKNSWGSDWGDSGYGWISYEDASWGDNAIAFDYQKADNYDHIYQYDGTCSINYITFYSDTVTQSNVFTARGKQDLQAVGFYTTQPGMDYSIQVYKNVTGTPSSGTAVYETLQTGRATYAGYHTIDLNQVVSLMDGEKYAVAVTYGRGSSGASGISTYIDKSNTWSWLEIVSNYNSGQGYYSTDNGASWTDASIQSCNLRIKAYTNDAVPVTGITLSPTNATIPVGGAKTITPTIAPSNASNKKVTWASSDSRIATVDANGKVTGVSSGTATITATTVSSGKQATCLVTVDATLQGIKLSSATTSMAIGDTSKLTVTYLPANTTSSKTVTWRSSNTSVATVSSAGAITAKATGTTVITATCNGKTATCTVTVYTPVQAFVARLYSKCLGRQPEAAGLADWNNRLITGQATGSSVGYGFVFSDEYKNKNTTDEQYVEMLYQVFLNRASDAGGKATWVNALSNGMSREYVFRGFAESTEYTNICSTYGIIKGSYTTTQARDQNPGLTSFIARMYTKALGRKYEEAGLNDWCNRVLTRQCTTEQAAEGFINSQEFRNKNLSNVEYVKTLYRTFFNREYDQGGLNNWVNKLNNGMSREEVLRGFSRSAEFYNLMHQYGL